MNENVEMALMEYDENLNKHYNRLIDEYMMIRVGRANPKLIENIKVDFDVQIKNLYQDNLLIKKTLYYSSYYVHIIKFHHFQKVVYLK